jgi:hypothetical protein
MEYLAIIALILIFTYLNRSIKNNRPPVKECGYFLTVNLANRL